MAEIAEAGSADQRQSRAWLPAIVAGAIALCFLSFEPSQRGRWDDSLYIVMAKSIASGRGVRLINYPSAPLATQRPPGYPFFLSLVMHLSSSFLALKLFSVAVYVASIFSLYYGFRKLSPGLIAPIVALYASSWFVLAYSYEVMAEMLYVLVSLLSIVCIAKYEAARRVWTVWLGFSALLVTAALNTRSVGLAVLAATLGWLLLRRRWKHLATFFVLTLLCCVAVRFLVTGREPAPAGGYNLKTLLLSADFLRIMPHQFLRYVYFLPISVWSIPYTAEGQISSDVRVVRIVIAVVMWTVSIGLDLVIVAGVLRLLHTRRGQLMALYVGGYLLVLLVWPSVPGIQRYLVPLVPFLMIFMLEGAVHILDKLAPAVTTGRKLLIVWLLAAVLLVSNLAESLFDVFVLDKNIVKLWHEYGTTESYDPRRKAYYDTALWAKSGGLPADAVVACLSPYDFYLWSERHSVQCACLPDKNQMVLLDAADYLVYQAKGAEAPDPTVSLIDVDGREAHDLRELGSQSGGAAGGGRTPVLPTVSREKMQIDEQLPGINTERMNQKLRRALRRHGDSRAPVTIEKVYETGTEWHTRVFKIVRGTGH